MGLTPRRDPIITFALLEGWVGLYGLASPYVFRLVGFVPAGLQFPLALILLLPATIAMGASLPILSRAFGQHNDWRFPIGSPRGSWSDRRSAPS